MRITDTIAAQTTCRILPPIQFALPFPIASAVTVLSPTDGALLIGVPFSATGQTRLLAVALPAGTVEPYPLPERQAVVIAGPDGCAYLGADSGRIWRFDPARQALEEIGQPVVDDAIRAGAVVGDTCWFGTVHGALLAITGDTVRVVATGTKPIVAISARPDGGVEAITTAGSISLQSAGELNTMAVSLPAGMRIGQAIALDSGQWLCCDENGMRLLRISSGGHVITTLPSLPDDDAVCCLRRVDGRVLASGRFTGAMYVLDDDAWILLGVPMPHDPLQFVALPDKRFAGITMHGRLVQSAGGGSMFALSALPVQEPDGQVIRALAMGSDRRLYFTAGDNMRFGCWNPATDEMVEYRPATPYPGAITAIGAAGERLYLGFGTPGGIMDFHPDLSFRLLENPKFAGQIGEGQGCPVCPPVLVEGKLFFATRSIEDDGEGALVSLTPLVDRLTVFPGILPGRQLTSLALDRRYGLLLVGGWRGTNRPAAVAGWSPAEARTLYEVSPFPSANTVYAWATDGGRALVTDASEQYAILDILTGEVCDAGPFPLGAITALTVTQHGILYGLAGGWLFRLDLDAEHIERLAEVTGAHLLEVRHNTFACTHGSRIVIVELDD